MGCIEVGFQLRQCFARACNGGRPIAQRQFAARTRDQRLADPCRRIGLDGVESGSLDGRVGIGEISRFQGAGFNPVSIGCGGFTDPSRVM
jgi:hypothetical protein